MSVHDLDNQTREALRVLAEKHGWTIEDLARAVLRPVQPTASGDPILGLMADDHELLDQVVEQAYEAREQPLRQSKQ